MSRTTALGRGLGVLCAYALSTVLLLPIVVASLVIFAIWSRKARPSHYGMGCKARVGGSYAALCWFCKIAERIWSVMVWLDPVGTMRWERDRVALERQSRHNPS